MAGLEPRQRVSQPSTQPFCMEGLMKHRIAPRFQPRLESLEDRCTPGPIAKPLDPRDTTGFVLPPTVASAPAALDIPPDTLGQQGGATVASAAHHADTHVVPFRVTGGGYAPLGLPVLPGSMAPHTATGTATHLGRYSGDEGRFELLTLDLATGTGTFRGSYVFVAADGDRLAMNYGADPANPGRFTLTPVGDGRRVALFVAEFTPAPGQSTGRFARFTGGSLTMLATTEPFVPMPDAQGYTPPFAYTWAGEGSLEFRRGGR